MVFGYDTYSRTQRATTFRRSRKLRFGSPYAPDMWVYMHAYIGGFKWLSFLFERQWPWLLLLLGGGGKA